MCGNPYHIPLNAAIRVASSTYTNSRLPRIACKHLALPVFTPARPQVAWRPCAVRGTSQRLLLSLLLPSRPGARAAVLALVVRSVRVVLGLPGLALFLLFLRLCGTLQGQCVGIALAALFGRAFQLCESRSWVTSLAHGAHASTGAPPPLPSTRHSHATYCSWHASWHAQRRAGGPSHAGFRGSAIKTAAASISAVPRTRHTSQRCTGYGCLTILPGASKWG